MTNIESTAKWTVKLIGSTLLAMQTMFFSRTFTGMPVNIGSSYMNQDKKIVIKLQVNGHRRYTFFSYPHNAC